MQVSMTMVSQNLLKTKGFYYEILAGIKMVDFL